MAMTNEEYEQAVYDEGQRRRLTFDMEVRAMIKEAVEIEREACAKVLDKMADEAERDHEPSGYVRYYREEAAAIRARSNNGL